MIVISLIALVYAIALPNFSLQRESQIADRLGRLSEDVRAVFDLAVLTGKPHRMIFNLASGEYIVEAAKDRNVTLAAATEEGGSGDPTPRQLEEKQAEFDEQFKEYERLAGESFKDVKTEAAIPPVSPVLKAKDSLKGTKWQAPEGMGWDKRQLGDFLLLKDIQAEHHAKPVNLDDPNESPWARVYFFPRGYVERTVMHIYLKRGPREADPDQPPYTIVIDPNLGTAEVRSGYEELNVHTGEE
jgi:type II secretory pathway pseudopilin PulG